MTQFPIAPGEYRQGWMAQFIAQVQQAMGFCVKNNEATGRIILRSPDGRSWAVTVDNTGTLAVTVMDGSER